MANSIYQSVRIRDIMSASVITVTLNQTVAFVLKLAKKHKVTGFPVVDDDGELIGIVSTFDLIQNVAIGKVNLKLGELPLNIRVDKEVVTLHKDMPVKAALVPMIKHRIGRIVITNKDNKVCGILSRKDIVNFFIEKMA